MILNYRLFENRKDAGIRLGQRLQIQYSNQDVLVFGIPKGGVQVAYEVAKLLKAEFSILVSKKLRLPGKEDINFAISEDGSTCFSSRTRNLKEDDMDKIKSELLQQIDKEIKVFRNGKSLPMIAGKTVIIVDDGISTGTTIVPALKLCRALNARKVIVASPVSGKNYSPEVDELADEILVVEFPDQYNSGEEIYQDFSNLTDEEVVAIMEKYENEKKQMDQNLLHNI